LDNLFPQSYIDFIKEHPEGFKLPNTNGRFLSCEDAKKAFIAGNHENSNSYPIFKYSDGQTYACLDIVTGEVLKCTDSVEHWKLAAKSFPLFLEFYEEDSFTIKD